MAGYYQKRGNKYYLTVSGGTNDKGKRIRYTRTVSAKNDYEAEKLLSKFIAEVDNHEYRKPSSLTFEQFIDTWKKDYAYPGLAPKTYKRYEDMLISRIVPALGRIKLENLKPLHLLEFYNNLREKGIRKDGKAGGLSEKTILHHHEVIASILQKAVDWDIIKTNPAIKVRPKGKSPTDLMKPTENFYDNQQISLLLSKLAQEDPKYAIMVILAISTGMRRGELVGLEWKDINFHNNAIRIIRTSQYVSGQGILTKGTKTRKSTREIAISKSVNSLLIAYREWQDNQKEKAGDLWVDKDRLFTQWNGTPIHPDTISQWFPEFLRRHDLPHITFHGLRHTNASILLAEGTDITTLCKRLGYSTPTTLLKVYAHSIPKADMEAAEKLDSAISEANISFLKKNTTKIKEIPKPPI